MKRNTYFEIKANVLEAYFEGCRDLALCEARPHAEIMGYIAYQFENSFDRIIENFMLRVVQLVVSGGWHAEAAQYARKQIAAQLQNYDIDTLLAEIPKSEADIFRHDLRILKII